MLESTRVAPCPFTPMGERKAVIPHTLSVQWDSTPSGDVAKVSKDCCAIEALSSCTCLSGLPARL